jgi:hypothetical protein
MFKKLFSLFKKEEPKKTKHSHYQKQSEEGKVSHSGPLYLKWMSMHRNCNNPNVKDYKVYGAKGIKVCERWDTFEQFEKDNREFSKGKTFFVRIDKKGDYTPENCLWNDSPVIVNKAQLNKLKKDQIYKLKEDQTHKVLEVKPKIVVEKPIVEDDVDLDEFMMKDRTQKLKQEAIKEMINQSQLQTGFLYTPSKIQRLKQEVDAEKLRQDAIKEAIDKVRPEPNSVYRPSSYANNVKYRALPNGFKSGKWTVLRPEIEGRTSYYLCMCQCGRERTITTRRLMSDKNNGCKACSLAVSREVCAQNRKERKEITGAGVKVGDVFGLRTLISFKSKSIGIFRCHCGSITEHWIRSIKMLKHGGCGACSHTYLLKSIEKNSPYSIGVTIGKWTIVSKEDKNVFLCKCSCGKEQLVTYKVLQAGGRFGCQQCKTDKEAKETRDRIAQCALLQVIAENKASIAKDIEDKKVVDKALEVTITPEHKPLEKLPTKLNLSIPSAKELDDYIIQAGELLRASVEISFEAKFKDRDGGLVLYWTKLDKTSNFFLQAAEYHGNSDITIKPMMPLIKCDLRIKIKACNNLKEFLDLFEMYIEDYLNGRSNKE